MADTHGRDKQQVPGGTEAEATLHLRQESSSQLPIKNRACLLCVHLISYTTDQKRK